MFKKDESEIKKIIKEAMTSISSSEHHMFSIPLEVSINSGNNWVRLIRRLNFDIKILRMII